MTDTPQAKQDLVRIQLTAETIAEKTKQIYDAMLAESPTMKKGNFESIGVPDLQRLFALYDEKFFDNRLAKILKEENTPLSFDLSRRLTRAAGKTIRYAQRKVLPGQPQPSVWYEIKMSVTLLYQTFSDVDRTVRVNGVVCRDRLEAMQRVFEHELIHLLEMVVWTKSSCSADPFRVLAWNLFGHPETKHDLITQNERASTVYDVRVGDHVTFEFEGVQYEGIVNRITKRATILIEDENGEPYRDGKRYRKFYVPLPMLKKRAD